MTPSLDLIRPLPCKKNSLSLKGIKSEDLFLVPPTRILLAPNGLEESIDYDETFVHVARLEAIRLLLAYVAHKEFKIFHIDVKVFLDGKLNEEDFVAQPLGFPDSKHPNHVYKLDKALYELKQTPRAWYDTLSTSLFSKIFERGKIDNTLFEVKWHIILAQIYVDDIIFGSTKYSLCDKFTKIMKSEDKMSMMGE
ncbi:LOW QUALITY PROTEIN: hypothetical protein OSB04_002371 [Centaurea solstitialis]|uniref:Reverse transcriptase Ty1/copia-type domain-containing protein n=1 Tax=Centaurea solstitialis TaxID=347529 RepID=A0AA38WT61_9ASTR|nr:LOW QUALITY PROTEIN: hypothetical protein OSB04_002371 [Centaurea solstitialis]